MLKHVNSEIVILASQFIFTISHWFLIQNISVASGYSGKFFENKFCRKTIFKVNQKWKTPPI